MTALAGRRAVIAATLAALALPVPTAFGAAAEDDEPVPSCLDSLFRDPEAARRVGRWLIAARAVPSCPEALAAQLASLAAPAQLSAASIADFAAGRLVEAGGVVLSRTEAYACALLAIAAPAQQGADRTQWESAQCAKMLA
jgi:hypothetical protein